jgi:F0F1-type ATP synthase beta subunit
MKSKEYTILFELWRRFIEDNSSRIDESVAGNQKSNMIKDIDAAYNSAVDFFNRVVKTKAGAIHALALIDNCVRSYSNYPASSPTDPEALELSAAATGDRFAEISSKDVTEVIEKFRRLKERITIEYGIENELNYE